MKFQDFLCGLFAGWSQIIFGQPFDYIKVKIQTETFVNQKSFIQMAKQIYSQHGIKGFYRGSSSLFFGLGFTIGTQFAVYQFSKRFIYNFRNKNSLGKKQYTDSSLKILDVSIAGAIVGFSISTIICPVQYCKIQRQLNPQQSKGSLSLLYQQLKNHQLKNITKGLSATIFKETIGSFVYYGLYEYMVRFLSKNQRQNANTFHYVFAGGLSGVAYWSVSYPIDVIKTKVQNGENYQNAFKGILNSGYRGFSIVLIRSLLVNGISFGVYQNTKQTIQYLKKIQ